MNIDLGVLDTLIAITMALLLLANSYISFLKPKNELIFYTTWITATYLPLLSITRLVGFILILSLYLFSLFILVYCNKRQCSLCNNKIHLLIIALVALAAVLLTLRL